jgi:hypothetical protein
VWPNTGLDLEMKIIAIMQLKVIPSALAYFLNGNYIRILGKDQEKEKEKESDRLLSLTMRRISPKMHH